MATIGLGFTLSANAQQMASGINAGVVELQKLGYAAKRTASDVATLRNIEIGRVFISSVQTIASTFTNFTSGAANAIDSTLKLSRSLGISYQELRTLQLAADLSGASSEQLATAFTRAQVTISKASNGNKEAVASLGRLGLAVDDLAGKSVTEQFSAIGAAISRIDDPAQRAAAAVAIFGRSGAELLPVFQGLPESLRQATSFLDQFKGGLTGVEAGRIEQLKDSFTLAGQAIQELAGKLLAELQPALQSGAEQFVAFVSQIDIGSAARTVEAALADLVSVLAALGRFAEPLAQNLLPAIGGYLAFINRQVLGAGIANLGRAFAAAAAGAIGYSSAAGTASAATVTLAASIRGLLVSTGIGALVVGLGLIGGAFVEAAISANSASGDVAASLQDPRQAIEQVRQSIRAATDDIDNFGQRAKDALKVPTFDAQDLAQEAVNEASAAVKALARELGGLNQVPAEVLGRFRELQELANGLDANGLAFGDAFAVASKDAQALTADIRKITETRKADEEATRQATDAVRKFAEESRKRTEELATAGIGDAEKSRLQLNKDLLAITREQQAATVALLNARQAGDTVAVQAAKERLQLARDAVVQAKEEDRQRRLQALGIDENLLQPAETIADQFRAVRNAFNQKLIDGGEARQALQNLAKEGIDIRREIAAELARPAQAALEVNDLRTSQGISAFLATTREDPAIAQRREQLQKLTEIANELRKQGVNPVDILGG